MAICAGVWPAVMCGVPSDVSAPVAVSWNTDMLATFEALPVTLRTYRKPPVASNASDCGLIPVPNR